LRGLEDYLIIFFQEHSEPDEYYPKIKDIITRFSNHNDYPLFKELRTLEKWIGERSLFGWIVNLAWRLKAYIHA